MKKSKNQRTSTQVAIFAGAAALMALTPNTHAQSTVNDLLNKLEQKGILTVDEADQLKAENATNSVTDFNQAFNSKFPMPDWVTSYKLYGDFRGRYDERTTFNPAQEDNIRLRYRLRVGLEVNMKDNLQVGFRLGSADPDSNGLGGNPVSNNTTLQGNGTKKFLYVDEAYGRWTPIHDDWTLAFTIGKMPNDYPFQVTPMVLDPDYTPEGGAIQTGYKINDWNSVAVSGAAFVLAYAGNNAAEDMSFLYGGQAMWNANWTDHVSSSLGVSAFDIVNRDQLTTATAGVGNSGNSLGAGGAPLYSLNPVIVDASVTYKLDSFPLYKGAFPIKLAGEYMNNPGAPGSGGTAGGEPNGNQGYNVGITLGHADKEGTWDIGYRYQALDANAWYAQIVNDDNLVFAGTPGSFPGGTNIKGHLFTADYALTDSLLFSFTCYVNSMIGNTLGGTAAPGSSAAMHAMADLMWKF